MDSQQHQQLLHKLLSDRVKERAEAASTLRSHHTHTPPSSATASTLLSVFSARLQLERKGPSAVSAVRDCKWAAVTALAGGRLSPDAARAVGETVSVLKDVEVLVDFCGTVASRVFDRGTAGREVPPGSVAALIDGGLWGRVVKALADTLAGASGREEAEFLGLVAKLCAYIPEPFTNNCRFVMDVGLKALLKSMNGGADKAAASAVDIILAVFHAAKQKALLGSVPKVPDFSPEWIRSRQLMQQTRLSELVLLCSENYDNYSLLPYEKVICNELTQGKLMSALSFSESDSTLKHISLLIFKSTPGVDLRTLLNARFTESRFWQLAVASGLRHDYSSIHLVLERLEKAPRDAHLYILRYLKGLCSGAEDAAVCSRIVRLCSICFLRNDCRDAALHVVEQLLMTNIASVELQSIDRMTETVLAVCESPNQHSASFLLTVLECRFKFEYWTDEAQKTHRAIVSWITQFPLSHFEVRLYKRLVSLPFAFDPGMFAEANAFKTILLGERPESCDKEILETYLLLHRPTEADAVELVKLLVKTIENLSNSSSPSQHLLTLESTKSDHTHEEIVQLLLAMHRMLCQQKLSTNVFFADAVKYLSGKIDHLSADDFILFVNAAESTALIDHLCIQKMEGILANRLYSSDPLVQIAARNLCCSLTLRAPSIAAFVANKVLLGLLAITDEQLRLLATMMADKRMIASLAFRGYSLDILSEKCADILPECLIIGDPSFELFTLWCQSDYLRNHGGLANQLALKLLQNWKSAPSYHHVSSIEQPLRSILPDSLLMFLQQPSGDIPYVPSVFWTSLCVMYCPNNENIPAEISKSAEYVKAALDFINKPKQRATPLKDADEYRFHATVLYISWRCDRKFFQNYLKQANFFTTLVAARLACFMAEWPFVAKDILDCIFAVDDALPVFLVDHILSSALSVSLPSDYETAVQASVLDVVKAVQDPLALTETIAVLCLKRMSFADVLEPLNAVVGFIDGSLAEIGTSFHPALKTLALRTRDKSVAARCLNALPYHSAGTPAKRLSLTGALTQSILSRKPIVCSLEVFMLLRWLLSNKTELASTLVDLQAVDSRLFAMITEHPPIPALTSSEGLILDALKLTIDDTAKAELTALIADGSKELKRAIKFVETSLEDHCKPRALTRLIMLCNSSQASDALLRSFDALAGLFSRHRQHMLPEEAVFCVESLRLSDTFHADIKVYKALDTFGTFEATPNYIDLLMNNSKTCSELKRIEMECLIMASSWTENHVPSTLLKYDDRVVYCKGKLQMLNNGADPLSCFAVEMRHRFDQARALDWFAEGLMTAAKVRLLDLVGKQTSDSTLMFVAGMEAARMLRRQGRLDDAIATAVALVSTHRLALPADKLAAGLVRTGKWLEEGRAALPNTVLDEYLEPAYKIAPPALQGKAVFRLASFLDHQWTELNRSGTLAAKAELLKNARQRLLQTKTTPATPNRAVVEKNRMQIEQQLSIDQEEYNRLSRDKAFYLTRLLECYLRVLILCNDRDQVASRFCSLWFSLSKDDLDAVNDKIQSILPAVPSHKFLPLIYQLAAKYQSLKRSDRTYQILTAMLKRLTNKHPFHSVLQFLALARGPRTGNGKRAVEELDMPLSNSRELLNAVKAMNTRSDVVDTIERLSDAYIELADLDVPKTRDSAFSIPPGLLARLQTVRCPILTRAIDPHPSGDYSRIVCLQSLDKQYRVIGGVNLPKILEFTGTDGLRYRQLVKGKDDVRQDAVVEQVFLQVNKMLLKRPKETVSLLRTYRVVPLHQRAGLLEWVTGAVPIGDYIIPAHPRLRPNDLEPSAARSIAKAEAERHGSTPQSRTDSFNDIQTRLGPIFRFFFLEKCLSVAHWSQSRREYQRSSATASFAGYILGLGDRHCQNILVDQHTGHLIHIDLNMIFEQGKTLRIPERVPFRLTADLRDAMGVHGVEHGFRRSACDLLERLRGQADGVIMVLEVFKHDPLHHWPSLDAAAIAPNSPHFDRLSDLMAADPSTYAVQSRDDQRFDLADRALLRVREKVEGREEGGQVSVAAQVQHLIQQASAPELLAQMYCGWQPWL